MIASVGSTMEGSATSSTRTSPAAYMMVARMCVLLSIAGVRRARVARRPREALRVAGSVGAVGVVVGNGDQRDEALRSGGDAGVVVVEIGGQLAVRVDLREQQSRLVLDALDHVLAGRPAQRRLIGIGQLDQRARELGRVAGLLAVHRGPERVD